MVVGLETWPPDERFIEWDPIPVSHHPPQTLSNFRNHITYFEVEINIGQKLLPQMLLTVISKLTNCNKG